jgi:hypothetical protein
MTGSCERAHAAVSFSTDGIPGWAGCGEEAPVRDADGCARVAPHGYGQDEGAERSIEGRCDPGRSEAASRVHQRLVEG